MATNTGFVNNLLGKLSNAKSGLTDALLGSAQVAPLTNNKYPTHIQEYLDNLESQPYMQGLLSKPKEEALTLDQYKEGITQGLNFGVPEIANWQKENGINIPETDEEISLAQTGDFNSYPLQAGLEGSERQGGILRDFFGGYRDNYLNGFSPDNWTPEKKSFSTHAGELLGSVGRFVDSPLGRGLIAGGLTAALGYKNPLQEGLAAVAGRQGAVTKDKLYRKQLQDMGIDTSDISGNITSDIYKDLISNSYKLRNLDQNTYMKMKTAYDRQLQQGIMTPAEYQASVEALNNQYVNSQIQTMQAGNVGVSNQTRNTNMNEQLLPYKQYALQMSPQIAMGNLGVAQGNLALNNARFNYQQEKDYLDAIQKAEEKANKKDEKQQTLEQLDTMMEFFNKLPQSNAPKGTQKGRALITGTFNKFGAQNDDETSFNSIRPLMVTRVMRKLQEERGVATDKDFDRASAMVPNSFDSPQQADAKVKAIKALFAGTSNINNMKNTNGFTIMKSPDGKTYKVPYNKVEEMKRKGGQVI